MVFIEPEAVVGFNNDLVAARAEALAAEEEVLWKLTGQLLGVIEQVQQVGGDRLPTQPVEVSDLIDFVCYDW